MMWHNRIETNDNTMSWMFDLSIISDCRVSSKVL